MVIGTEYLAFCGECEDEMASSGDMHKPCVDVQLYLRTDTYLSLIRCIIMGITECHCL